MIWKTTALAALALSCAISMVSCGNNNTSTPMPASPQPGQTPQSSPTPMATVTISPGAAGMGTRAYGANPLVIQPGTTVMWVNQDSMTHTATSTSGVWDSGPIAPGQNYSRRFDEPGTFPYFCTIHGMESMSGTIEVTGASPSPSPSPSVSPVPAPSPSMSLMPSSS